MSHNFIARFPDLIFSISFGIDKDLFPVNGKKSYYIFVDGEVF